MEYVDLGSKDLRVIEQTRHEVLQLTRTESKVDENDENDYDPDDVTEETQSSQVNAGTNTILEKTQSIAHIRVTKPGTVRLQRVYDSSSQTDARISTVEVTVAPCPTASFMDDAISKGDHIHCIGTTQELTVKVYGVPPLSLKWHRELKNGRRQQFSIERIEGSHEVSLLHYGYGLGSMVAFRCMVSRKNYAFHCICPLTHQVDSPMYLTHSRMD